jgi:hypothetical protein
MCCIRRKRLGMWRDQPSGVETRALCPIGPQGGQRWSELAGLTAVIGAGGVDWTAKGG